MHPAIDADLLARAAQRVEALRSAELRAAAVPWEVGRDGNILTSGQDREDVAIFGTPNFEPDGGDMAAIVALRNAAPDLIAITAAALAWETARNIDPNESPRWLDEVHRTINELRVAVDRFVGAEP